MRPVDLVLERVENRERRNGHFMASCPAHEDPEPSLSIKEGDDGRALLHCFAGCEVPEIVAALGLEMTDLFPSSTNGRHSGRRKSGRGKPTATWSIRGAGGELQAEHVRFGREGGGKDCLWRLPGTRGWGLKGRKLWTLPLYRSELVKEWPGDIPVIVVEGEKAADALAAVHPVVLGTVTGAEGVPGPEALAVLRGRRVVLWPDNDEAGRKHMERSAAALQGVAREVRIYEWAGAPEKGDAADHPAVKSREPADLEKLLAELATAPVWKPDGNLSSQRPISIRIGTLGRKPTAVKFSEMEPPGPRCYLLEDLVLAAYVTLLYGDGGVAKSMLALALGLAVAGDQEMWLGKDVENGPVLYLDFELDAEEQARRVNQLCRGDGLARPPSGLLYMSALGYTARTAFEAAREACEEHGVKLLVLDSLGPALGGDAEASKDVIGFFQEVVEPFRALGVAVLIIDHQSKLQAGQSYQSKGAFGSVFKTNLARSVLQVEATERGEGTLTVRVRQKKHNFGPLAEPFGIKLTFSEESVVLEAAELEAADLAEEGTLDVPERVKLALEAGPAYPWEIADATGILLKTVKNALTGLRKQGIVEPTGEKDGRAEQVRIIVPASRVPIETGQWDDTENAGWVEGAV